MLMIDSMSFLYAKESKFTLHKVAQCTVCCLGTFDWKRCEITSWSNIVLFSVFVLSLSLFIYLFGFFLCARIFPSITTRMQSIWESSVPKSTNKTKREQSFFPLSRSTNIKRATTTASNGKKNIFALNNYIFSSEPLEMVGICKFHSFFSFLGLCWCRCWSMFWHFVYFVAPKSVHPTILPCLFLSCRCLQLTKQDIDFLFR